MVFVDTVGEIDVYTAPKLREVLVDLMADAPPQVYVLNIRQVDYLDSTGFGVLVGGLKRARAQRSEVVLICTTERILKVFRVNGLIRVFPIYKSEEAVLTEKKWISWDRATDVVVDTEEVIMGFPVWAYFADQAISRIFTGFLDRMLNAFDLEIIYYGEGRFRGAREVGVRARSGSRATTASATEQSSRLRAALQGRPVDLDPAESRAIALFEQILDRATAAVVQIASLMVVKVDGRRESRNLTQPELRYWFYNEHLKSDPEVAIRLLRSPPGPLELRLLGQDRSPRLRALAAETLDILEAGGYVNPDGQWVPLTSASPRTHLRDEPLTLQRRHKRARFEVVNESTLQAAARMGGNPAVLGFASPRPPGRAYRDGAQSQETSLLRASTLHTALAGAEDFHADADAVLYSAGVQVFRDDDGDLLAEPYEISVISAVAPSGRAAIDAGIKRLLAVAQTHGHDTLVLGAWGCGARGNDPAVVASLFRKHLAGGRFAHVVFAVLGEPAMTAFRTAFSGHRRTR